MMTFSAVYKPFHRINEIPVEKSKTLTVNSELILSQVETLKEALSIKYNAESPQKHPNT